MSILHFSTFIIYIYQKELLIWLFGLCDLLSLAADMPNVKYGY